MERHGAKVHWVHVAAKALYQRVLASEDVAVRRRHGRPHCSVQGTQPRCAPTCHPGLQHSLLKTVAAAEPERRSGLRPQRRCLGLTSSQSEATTPVATSSLDEATRRSRRRWVPVPTREEGGHDRSRFPRTTGIRQRVPWTSARVPMAAWSCSRVDATCARVMPAAGGRPPWPRYPLADREHQGPPRSRPSH